MIGRLAPNDYTVEAYYLPDEQGNVPEVYIYQHGAYIATCRRIEAYNEATAEQTERDREAYAEQAKYNAQFDAMMAREKICKVRLLPGDVPAHEEPEIVEAAPAEEAPAQPAEEAAPAAPPEEAEVFDFGIDYAALAKHEL